MNRDEALNVLGLGANASADEIRGRSIKLFMEYHPDRHPEVAGNEVLRKLLSEQFNRVKQAHDFLMDFEEHIRSQRGGPSASPVPQNDRFEVSDEEEEEENEEDENEEDEDSLDAFEKDSAGQQASTNEPDLANESRPTGALGAAGHALTAGCMGWIALFGVVGGVALMCTGVGIIHGFFLARNSMQHLLWYSSDSNVRTEGTGCGLVFSGMILWVAIAVGVAWVAIEKFKQPAGKPNYKTRESNQPGWPPSHEKVPTTSRITSRVLVESAFISKTVGVVSRRPVINSVAWAPDSQELAAIGDLDAYGAAALGQFVVKFWDSSGTEKASVPLDLDPRTGSPEIAYSNTGSFVVAGSNGDWRIAKRDGLRFTPLILHNMRGMKVSLSYVAFSPDDKELICVSDGHVMDAQGHVASRVFLADVGTNVLAGAITPKAELDWIKGTAKNAFYANAGKEVCLSGSFLMDRNYFEDGVAVFDRSTRKYLRFVGTPKNVSRDEYVDPESGIVFYWGGFHRIWAFSLLTEGLAWELADRDGRLLGSNGLFLLFDSKGKVSAWDATGKTAFESEFIGGFGDGAFSVRPDRKAIAIASCVSDDSAKQDVGRIHLVEFK